MKKTIQKILTIFLLFLIIIPLGTPRIVEAKTSSGTKIITLNKGYHVLSPKKRVTLRPTIHKAKFRSKKIIWTSSNKSVAKVSSRGSVLGKKKGKATITARISGTKYKATCKIVVGTPVKAIRIPSASLSLYEKDTYRLKVTVLPSNASRKDVTFQSSDQSVAKVTSTGTIYAAAPGKATITICSKDGTNVKKKLNVTVLKKTIPPEKPEDEEEVHNPAEEPNPPSSTDDTSQESDKEQESDSNNEQVPDTPEQVLNPRQVQLMAYMDKYTAFFKQYGNLFLKDANASAAKCSYAQAKAYAEQNITVKVNCTFPYNWALQEMGILPLKNQFYGITTGFKYKSAYMRNNTNFQSKMDFLYYDSPVEYSVQKAAENGLLMKGDILSICIIRGTSYVNHSAVYAGMSSEGHAIVYEAGGIPQTAGYGNVGCGPLDYSKYSNYIVKEVIRLK